MCFVDLRSVRFVEARDFSRGRTARAVQFGGRELKLRFSAGPRMRASRVRQR